MLFFMETNCSKAHVTKHLCKVFFFWRRREHRKWRVRRYVW